MSQQDQHLDQEDPTTLMEQTQRSETEVAEAQTGTTPINRTEPGMEPSPSQVDPRFDRDDLRQGKPPPATRQGGLLHSVAGGPRHLGHGLKKMRKIKVRRPRLGGANKRREELTEEDMTDEEIEVGEEEDLEELTGNQPVPVEAGKEQQEQEKKGVLGKLLGK